MRKKIMISLGLVLSVLVLGFGVLQTKTYPARQEASALWQENPHQQADYAYFPAEKPQASLVFYGGGLVEEEAYALLANQFAQAGIDVYLVKSPLHLPILARGKARNIIEEESLDKVYLAGHSLGGVVAAMAAQDLYQEGRLAGLLLLASYPSDGVDLRDSSLPVLSLTASQDKVLNWSAFEEAKKRLPSTTQFVNIVGGNHSGFGSYGPQAGDGSASLQPGQQLATVVDRFLVFMKENDDQNDHIK